MDGAILVVSATDGPMPQTREHILLARQVRNAALPAKAFQQGMPVSWPGGCHLHAIMQLRHSLQVGAVPAQLWGWPPACHPGSCGRVCRWWQPCTAAGLQPLQAASHMEGSLRLQPGIVSCMCHQCKALSSKPRLPPAPRLGFGWAAVHFLSQASVVQQLRWMPVLFPKHIMHSAAGGHKVPEVVICRWACPASCAF